jgi:hypothetical protein
MSNLTILHRIRQFKGALRQPYHGPVMHALEAQLGAMGLSHPYRLVRNRAINQVDSLLRVRGFAPGGIGNTGNPTSGFIYHLTSVRKAITYSQWQYFPSGFPSLSHEDRKLFEYLLDDYNRRGDWLSFSAYAQDEYSGFRSFTWWTNLEVLDGPVVCSAHKLGLPNKWIPKYALVMRCPAVYARDNSLSRVPTTIDGFLSEVFSPPDLRPLNRPVSGRTIDLDSPGALREGADEYALTSIPVDQIDFKPILIDYTLRRGHIVARNARLWQLLEIYYNRL